MFIANKHSLPARLALSVVLIVCQMVNESCQNRDNIAVSNAVSNQDHSQRRISINNQQETIKMGNTETNNYNILEKNIQPSQQTSVVINVGKFKDKTRATRPPTLEEYEIKKRIMEIYEEAKSELDPYSEDKPIYFNHLGRILTVLNPKYIATYRVRNVAFADPRNPNVEVVSPESELPPPQPLDDVGEPMLVLNNDGRVSIQDQLDIVDQRLRNMVSWDKEFEDELFQTPDDQFTPRQLAFKRLIQCLAKPGFCKQKLITKIRPAKDHEDFGSKNVIDQLIDEASQLDQHAIPEDIEDELKEFELNRPIHEPAPEEDRSFRPADAQRMRYQEPPSRAPVYQADRRPMRTREEFGYTPRERHDPGQPQQRRRQQQQPPQEQQQQQQPRPREQQQWRQFEQQWQQLQENRFHPERQYQFPQQQPPPQQQSVRATPPPFAKPMRPRNVDAPRPFNSGGFGSNHTFRPRPVPAY